MWIKSRCLDNEDVHVFGYGARVWVRWPRTGVSRGCWDQKTLIYGGDSRRMRRYLKEEKAWE